jgi:hypothetical protein
VNLTEQVEVAYNKTKGDVAGENGAVGDSSAPRGWMTPAGYFHPDLEGLVL